MKRKVADQKDDFFVAGLEKYLDAASAVTMFEMELQRRVKEVVTRHQSVLAGLFGEDWRLRDYVEPSTPDYVCLGQRVTFKESGALYLYFRFGRDELEAPWVVPGAMFWRERLTLLNRLWISIDTIRSPKLEVDKWSIYLQGDEPSNDWASCEKALDALLRDWIKLWQKLGGLPKYLRKSHQ